VNYYLHVSRTSLADQIPAGKTKLNGVQYTYLPNLDVFLRLDLFKRHRTAIRQMTDVGALKQLIKL
jgi:hypothetical protein